MQLVAGGEFAVAAECREEIGIFSERTGEEVGIPLVEVFLQIGIPVEGARTVECVAPREADCLQVRIIGADGLVDFLEMRLLEAVDSQIRLVERGDSNHFVAVVAADCLHVCIDQTGPFIEVLGSLLPVVFIYRIPGLVEFRVSRIVNALLDIVVIFLEVGMAGIKIQENIDFLIAGTFLFKQRYYAHSVAQLFGATAFGYESLLCYESVGVERHAHHAHIVG